MVVIKIDRSSIKKNPNAGKQFTNVQGMREVKFSCYLTVSEFEKLNNTRGVIISEYRDSPNSDKLNVSGYLDDIEFASLLPDTHEIEAKIHVEKVYHLPLPNWLYKHEDTKIICDECGSLVLYRNIEKDYDDDGVDFDVCPICKNVNTFEYEFETIDEALKTASNE